MPPHPLVVFDTNVLIPLIIPASHQAIVRWSLANSSAVIRGIIHGKIIELESESGLPDGQEVTVTVEPVAVPNPVSPPSFPTESQSRWEAARVQVKDLPPGEGLRLSFGSWAEDADELDQYLEWNRQQRKLGRPELEP
jgi:hypothetical protein